MSIPAHSPKYADFGHTAIDLVIEHPEFGTIPFTASPSDTAPLGQDLYTQAVAGAFGEIAAYDGLSPEEVLTEQMRTQRDALLAQLDAIVNNPLRWAEYTAEQQAALAAYRQALLDVPQQEGFPSEIDWPEMPAF